MKTNSMQRLALRILMLLAAVGSVLAAETPEEALRRGVLAEEVQRNMTAAQRAYEDAVRLAESQREAAAAALYRLAEVQRLQGATNESRVALEQLIRRYPEATNWVSVARRQLGVLDSATTGKGRSTSLRKERLALERQQQELDRTLTALARLDSKDLVERLVVDHPNDRLVQLANDRAGLERERASLAAEFGPQHPKRVELERRVEVIETQLERACRAVMASLREKLDRVNRDLDQLGALSAISGVGEGVEDTGSPAESADDLLRQEITLAEEQVKIAQKRFENGTGSQEDLIKSRREVLALKRQMQVRPALVALPESAAAGGSEEASSVDPKMVEELARLRKLASESPDLLRRSSDGETPLQRAVVRGWKPVVEYLLDLGVPPDVVVDKEDRGTALHRVARAGNLELATLLLDRGADVNVRGNSRETPLHCAVRAGHRAMAELLIQRGAALDLQTEPAVGRAYSGWEGEYYGNTPLHLAAYYGLPTLVDLLVQRGASVYSLNRNGLSPLFAAVVGRQDDCVARLLAAGSPVNVNALVSLRIGNNPTRVSVNPVQWAAYESEHELLKRLLESGGSPYTRIAAGPTLLHWAAYRGDDSLAELLLAAGAQVNAPDARGRTPLDYVNPEFKAVQARLRAAAGTNGILKPRVSPSPVGVTKDGSPQVVPVEAPDLFNIYPTILGGHLIDNQVRVSGEAFGTRILDGTPMPNLREWIRSLDPAPTADLTHVVRIRKDPQTGLQRREMVDLTDPSADLVIKGAEEIFVPALPRKP